MRAALYLRTATAGEQDSQPTAIAAQRLVLEEYCRAKGLEITGVYSDEGYSGNTLSRPGLEQLLIEADQRRFQAVVVADATHFSRDLRDIILLIDELASHGVKVVSAKDDCDWLGLDGKVVLAILQRFAGWESEGR